MIDLVLNFFSCLVWLNHSSKVLNPLFLKWKDLDEPYNRCRQELPQCYIHNGYIDIMNRDTIIKYKSVTGPKIYPYVMDDTENRDIDYEDDL